MLCSSVRGFHGQPLTHSPAPPSQTHVILTQSWQLLEAMSVSSSSLPWNLGGRWLIRCGTRSNTPTGMYLIHNQCWISGDRQWVRGQRSEKDGTYLYKKLSHSSKKRLVFSTPYSNTAKVTTEAESSAAVFPGWWVAV